MVQPLKLLPDGTDFARLRRLMRKDGLFLHKTRGERWRGDLGDWYVVDERNVIAATGINPEAWLAEYLREAA